MSHLDAGRSRLMQIKWPTTYNYSAQGDHEILVTNFLIGAAQWAEALGCQPEWPFFDVARKIEPDHIFADSSKIRDTLPSSSTIWFACESYLHWLELTDRASLSTYQDLPEPYEPLIRAFEAGLNSLYPEAGFLMVGTMGIRLRGESFLRAAGQPRRV